MNKGFGTFVIIVFAIVTSFIANGILEAFVLGSDMPTKSIANIYYATAVTWCLVVDGFVLLVKKQTKCCKN